MNARSTFGGFGIHNINNSNDGFMFKKAYIIGSSGSDVIDEIFHIFFRNRKSLAIKSDLVYDDNFFYAQREIFLMWISCFLLFFR